jgi:RimJ/RimL family protein N-acetyltransferase
LNLPEGVVIRRGVVEDVPALVDLHESVASEGNWIATEVPFDRDERTNRWIAGFTEEGAGVWFLAERDGRLLGSASLGKFTPGLWRLGMSVAKGERGQGLGTALLGECIRWARDSGAHKITLEVWPHNDAAIALYERAGFEREGVLRRQYRRRSGEIWDSVVMGLLLDP